MSKRTAAVHARSGAVRTAAVFWGQRIQPDHASPHPTSARPPRQPAKTAARSCPHRRRRMEETTSPTYHATPTTSTRYLADRFDRISLHATASPLCRQWRHSPSRRRLDRLVHRHTRQQCRHPGRLLLDFGPELGSVRFHASTQMARKPPRVGLRRNPQRRLNNSPHPLRHRQPRIPCRSLPRHPLLLRQPHPQHLRHRHAPTVATGSRCSNRLLLQQIKLLLQPNPAEI